MKQKIRGLHLIINTDPAPVCPFLELALQGLSGGVDSLQLRHKGTYTKEMISLGHQLVEMGRRFSVPLIVNDRIDIALAIDAAGVHLGQTDLPLHIARKWLGEDKIIGATAENLEQAKKAEQEGADYIGFGHIFPTRTKVKTTPPVGLALLEEVCRQVSIPVLAIGGIGEDNLDAVCKTKAGGVAIVSAIAGFPNPYERTKQFKTILQNYEH